MHQSELDPIPPGSFALVLVSGPLAAFGGLTLARYISQTVEGDGTDATVARRNHRQCAVISVVVVLVAILTPVVVHSSTAGDDGADGYG